MAFDKQLLTILACPITKGALHYDKDNNELISVSAKLAYPKKDNIPVLLETEARVISEKEADLWRSK